ncbi:MAG: hypothetical protein FD153_597, partial [Rhodospirillaceae bacterium]
MNKQQTNNTQTRQQTGFLCSTVGPFDLDEMLDLIARSLANDKAEDVIVVNLNGKA